MTPILEVRDLQTQLCTHRFHIGVVRAVDGVSRAGQAGETLGIVGESGRGKRATIVAAARCGSMAAGWSRTRDAADQIGARS